MPSADPRDFARVFLLLPATRVRQERRVDAHTPRDGLRERIGLEHHRLDLDARGLDVALLISVVKFNVEVPAAALDRS